MVFRTMTARYVLRLAAEGMCSCEKYVLVLIKIYIHMYVLKYRAYHDIFKVLLQNGPAYTPSRWQVAKTIFILKTGREN